MTTPNTAEHTSIDQSGPPRAGHVTAWTTWADLTWARTCPPWMHADGLSASQRLLLGMVLFGPGSDYGRHAAAGVDDLDEQQADSKRRGQRAMRFTTPRRVDMPPSLDLSRG